MSIQYCKGTPHGTLDLESLLYNVTIFFGKFVLSLAPYAKTSVQNFARLLRCDHEITPSQKIVYVYFFLPLLQNHPSPGDAVAAVYPLRHQRIVGTAKDLCHAALNLKLDPSQGELSPLYQYEAAEDKSSCATNEMSKKKTWVSHASRASVTSRPVSTTIVSKLVQNGSSVARKSQSKSMTKN